MRFILWLSGRLKLTGKSKANATGVAIAVTGVALAIIIMLCTLGVARGFKEQITDRIMGFDGNISILPAYDPGADSSAAYVRLDPDIRAHIIESVPATEISLKLNQPGLLKTDSDFAGIYFVGYDTNHDYAFERQSIIEGQLPDFSSPDDANKIAISRSTALSLGLELGDKVNACFFADEAVRTRRFEIAAIYETGFSDYDKTIAFAPLATLQRVAHIDSLSGSAININIADRQAIPEQAARLQDRLIDLYQYGQLDDLYPVDNVRHTGAAFFNWLDLLDTNVVVIFILMACVAGFTLISSMFILILDRIPAIGLLRSLGATRRQIRLIFVTMAMKTVGLGIIIGNVLGLGLLLAQQRWQFLRLDPDMYYLKSVPVSITPADIILLNLATAAAAWLILVLPSRLAASVSPASTLRFE
ncbi:MAG: ABC transporter permease [Muribaculaceae bacterium]|nr:ABC transporter permease [Muribaculaceae bacterium]